MTNKINDGGAAFPRPLGDTEIESPLGGTKGIYNTSQTGMSLRDYFAATVLPIIYNGAPQKSIAMAREAYQVADAMLKAREEQP